MEQWDASDALSDVSLDSGHLTGLLARNLEVVPDAKVATSSWYDLIIGDIFLKVDPTDFRDSETETRVLHEAFPDYRRFVIDGRMHTTLLGDPSGIVGSDLSSVEVPVEDLGALAEMSLADSTRPRRQTAFHAWLRARGRKPGGQTSRTLRGPHQVGNVRRTGLPTNRLTSTRRSHRG